MLGLKTRASSLSTGSRLPDGKRQQAAAVHGGCATETLIGARRCLRMHARFFRHSLAMVAGMLVSLAPARQPQAAVEPQPFLASLRALLDATDYLGTPFSADE